MSRITDPAITALAASDEEAWEGFTDDSVIFQRPCPDCDKGLLYYPARFCGKCGGSGRIARTVVLHAGHD